MDFYIFQLINQFADKWVFLDSLGIFFAEYSGYFLIALLLGFLFFGNKKRNLIMVCEAFLSAILARLVITNIIRLIYFKPRPFVNNQVNLLLSQEATGSFPSGHAAFFFAISLVVYFYNKKVGILFFIISFLMGVARIFAGVHYPFDIFGGILVGLFSAWAINKIFKNLKLFQKYQIPAN